MKVHYPKLYNMAHLSLNVFTASKGSNNYILFKGVYITRTCFPDVGDRCDLYPALSLDFR